MSDLSFALLSPTPATAARALYRSTEPIPAGATRSTLFYVAFLGDGVTAPTPIDLTQCFDLSGPVGRGAFVFVDDAPQPGAPAQPDPTSLNALWADLLAHLVVTANPLTYTRLAWRQSEGQYDLVSQSDQQAVSSAAQLSFGRWIVAVGTSTGIAQGAGDAVALKSAGGQVGNTLLVNVQAGNVTNQAGTAPSEIDIPLTGDHTGAMTFDWQWQHRALTDQFGGELRTFHGDDVSSATTIRYPLFLPAPDPGPRPRNDLAFSVTAHPLAPLSGARTRLALSATPPSGFNQLTGQRMITPSGSSVQLTPKATGTTTDGAGFGFATTATTPPSADTDLYLTPVGSFEVSAAPLSTNTSNGSTNVQVMAGMAGTEFVLTDVGDVVTFENNQAAFAKGFVAGAGQVALTDELTTSWVSVQTANGANADSGVVPTSYCSQPTRSTYFARQGAQPAQSFSVAVGISLSDLSTNPLFPMLPYGGVFYEDPANGIANPNPTIAAQTVGDIETQVVEPSRHAVLQPTYDTQWGPIFFDASANTAFQGGSVRTPIGFIAGLNGAPVAPATTPPQGSWATMQIALSPQSDAPSDSRLLQLRPNGNGVVNPTFSNAVLRDNLFMVVTDPDLLWPWNPADPKAAFPQGCQIKLGDFTFAVGVGPKQQNDSEYPRAMVVFKFVTGITFTDLVAAGNTDRWTGFFGAGDTTATVQAQIQQYLDKAKQGNAELYAAFNAIVDDPNWTGMLVFNCPLNGQELPSDLQILLGGIDEALRAHHFGVTINRLTDQATDGTTNASFQIADSSLFAVIDYDQPLGPVNTPPNLQVLLLNVQFANSKLVVFRSTIAFSIDAMFGNAVQLTVAPDTDQKSTGTIVIDGAYTVHPDGTGSLVFVTDDTRVFAVPDGDTHTRVVQAEEVNDATLVPISSTTSNGETLATAAFRVDMRMVLETGVAGDLFSYGEYEDGGSGNTRVPSTGLDVVDYAFPMTTTIPTQGRATIWYQPDDLSALKVDQVTSASRADSFGKKFPNKIDSLLNFPKGLTPSQAGAWWVENDDIYDPDSDESDLNTPVPPVYALDFKIPMGNLGGLVSSTNNIVSDLYVGWKPGGSNDDDQVGVVLQLSPVIAGPDGFQLQGVARSSFESVHLDYLSWTSAKDGSEITAYAMRFQSFVSKLLNIPLMGYSNDQTDLGIFGPPTDPGGDNSVWYVGKSAADGGGNKLEWSAMLEPPYIFIGRSFAIETDPTNPDVIDEAIGQLQQFAGWTVEQYIQNLYADSGQYDSSAGMTFALQFDFAVIAMGLLFHDNDFYGAKIAINIPGGDDDGGGGDGGGGEGGGGESGTSNAPAETGNGNGGGNGGNGNGGNGEKKKSVNKLQGLEFTIIYRKISDHLGVWSSTVFIDVGTIELGAASLTLPDFSVSVWTNGDWRFSIGWPLDNHPIVVQFQAGPVPVVGKLGLYLAKLRSADAPDTFAVTDNPDECPPNFALIWMFGIGISAGIGKEWESGPLSAGASLSIQLTAQGFLASYSGNMTENGVDYHWVCISLGLVGEAFGKVDFVIISAELSISLSLMLSAAFETLHSTLIELTFNATVEAKVHIIFFTIHFSFSVTLTILSTTFGSGPAASVDGPNPKAVLGPKALDVAPMADAAQREMFAAIGETAADVPSITVDASFVLQSTATSTDGTNWTPQGVACVVIESGDPTTPFGQLCNHLATWLIAQWGGATTDFQQQLSNVATALQAGQFADQISAYLGNVVFNIGTAPTPDPNQPLPSVAAFPMPSALGLAYNNAQTPFGAPAVPTTYLNAVATYFDPSETDVGTASADDTVASLLFDQYLEMLAKQLVADLQQTGAASLSAAFTSTTPNVVVNVGGFVSRFLMGGTRLPDPANMATLSPLYVLTHQQFPLDPAVLSASLYAAQTLPSWVTLDGTPSATLTAGQVLDVPPTAFGGVASVTPPISPVAVRFPLNASFVWTDANSVASSVFPYGDGIHLAIENWIADPGNDPATGPWLGLWEIDASQPPPPGGMQPTTAYTGNGALLLPLTIKTIPQPGGTAGQTLDGIYSLIGTDEVHRAYLQALLDDPNASIQRVDLMVNSGQGTYASTKVPDVLVRTNLSTSTAPSGGGQAALIADDAVAAVGAPNDYCANYAKLADRGDALGQFLRLVWECSVVHTGGFYLQVAGLDASAFVDGEAPLQLLVQTTTAATDIPAEPYHNAMVGPSPAKASGVVADLNSAKGSAPVVTYSASYAGGSTGWTITWENPNSEPDASGGDPAAFLQGLYSMISYRITQVGSTPITSSWSRPVTALQSAAGQTPVWTYQRSFAAAPLLGAGENTYAAVGQDVAVEISIEDIFGNSIPFSGAPPLPVVYNDDLLSLAHWAKTQTSYQVSESAQGGMVDLDVNFGYGALLLSLGDFTSISAMAAQLVAHPDPVSTYLWSTYDSADQATLTNTQSPPNIVQQVLIGGLNAQLGGGKSLATLADFSAVALSAQTKALMATNPTGTALTFLNRLLVQDAYPTLIQAEIAEGLDLQTVSEELRVYTIVLNQLQDPNLSAAINTADLLAPDTPITGDPPTGALTGAAVLDPLRSFVGSIVAWLTAQQAKLQGQNPAAVDTPQPVTMTLPVDKDRPVSWSGDLRELRVDLLLRRANVESNIAALAPLVQSVTSPITPVQAPSTDVDPTGLSAFARSLEQAYYGFDGQPDGVIKVATGVNSDLTSTRLGMPSLWLARWGETAGMTVEILNDDDNPPVYYAPPPLSTQLITRTVDQLIDYSGGANSPKDAPPKVFSSVDVDAVAAAFLSSVELIFSAPIAPQVADLSAPTADDIYDSYVGSKSDLAGYIADTLTYIYNGFTGDGAKPSDPTSATEAMRQALLTSLENDYGMSALVQMAALITLHGEIEPGAKSPPNIYGNVAVTGTPELGDGTSSTMPYTFTPAKLPLVSGTTWLNTLLSVQDPSLQNALTLQLAYQMGFIEYDIDPDETRCDYTPSNWLTFVLQRGSPDPGPAQNTLTASMGEPRIPIPLRSYPPLPQLISATATQVNPAQSITTIDEALTWNYVLTVGRPSALQDTLNLLITFNEPAGQQVGAPSPVAGPSRPGDLFDQLARYSYEYPYLQADIHALATGGTANSTAALKAFQTIAGDVAATWQGWVPPPPPDPVTLPVNTIAYTIDTDQDTGSLLCTAAWSQNTTAPTNFGWPQIDDYEFPPQSTGASSAKYKLTAQAPPSQLTIHWGPFYVLDYQSAHASAFIQRNANLGGDTGWSTNPAFVYTTETVQLPTPAVPLISVPTTIVESLGSGLPNAVDAIFVAMHTPPSGSIQAPSGDGRVLCLQGPISYSYELLANPSGNGDAPVNSILPLYLLQLDIADGADQDAANTTAGTLSGWQSERKPNPAGGAFAFNFTIFATKIVEGDAQLPLVQFQEVSIPLSS